MAAASISLGLQLLGVVTVACMDSSYHDNRVHSDQARLLDFEFLRKKRLLVWISIEHGLASAYAGFSLSWILQNDSMECQ